MKKILLVAIGAMFSLQAVADPMVRGGAFGRRVDNAFDDALFDGTAKVGSWAGRKVGGWGDDFCQYTFGVDGKTVADKVATAALIAVLATCVYKTGQYLVYRESNSSKVSRAMSIWSQMDARLHTVMTKQELQEFVQDFVHLEQSVLDAYTSLNNRYGSYVKPWNWTSDMQEAHAKMQLVSIIFKYQDIIAIEYDYNEPALLKIAKRDISSLTMLPGAHLSSVTAYPICAYVQKMQEDIERLKSLTSYAVAFVMLQELQQVVRIIGGSDECIKERKDLQDAIARERLINAVDRHY